MQDFIERAICSSPTHPRLTQDANSYKPRLLRHGLLLVFCFVFSVGAYAQEICNNGLDDDNDGYVDCFDPDCSGNFFCSSQFFGGPVPTCQTTLPPAPPFAMTQMWATDSVATPLNSRRTPVIGDIDLDGIPEVISGLAGIPNSSYVYNGANGALERTLATAALSGSSSYAIADIDNDGFGEIVVVAATSRQLICYEHNGAIKWASAVPIGYSVLDDNWTPAFADFEEDGLPEIYLGNQIYNGSNGNFICSSGSAGAKGANAGTPNEPFSIAADVLPNAFCPDCAGLELVAGNTVYSVNLAAGTMTSRINITGGPDGMTSLGDIDRDGDIDAVVVGQNASGRGVVYAWDLQTTAQIGTTFQIDAVSTAGGAITASGGIASVADVDNNGVMDVIVTGRNVAVCLQYNPGINTFTEKWSVSTVNFSGRSGTTLFDFEGDGQLEVILRDEILLRIYNAANGTQRLTAPCAGQTRLETPLVADVDNNGQANIVCGCGGRMVAYQPAGVPWVGTRTLWNQRQYFVLNIRDNLRVPRTQQRQEVGFPAGSPVNYPFNAFMKQTTRLADNGALVNPAANDAVTILNPLTDVDLGSCQNGVRDSIGVRLTVTNSGSTTLPIGTRVAFYNGNPYMPGAIFMQNYTMTSSVPAGSSLTLPMVYVGDQGGTFTLFYQINDDGSNPIPITGPATGHQECNYANNMGSYSIVNCGNLPPVIDTLGFSTTTIVINSTEDQPVIFCVSATDPQNDGHDVTALIGGPTLGAVSGLNDGDSCITLTPNLNVNGSTIFQIIVCDNANVPLCDTATIIWNVMPANDPPIAINDTDTTLEDTPVSQDVLLNDTDVESNPLTVTITGGASNGTATLAGSVITYTPAPNFFGIDTVAYQVCDNALPPGCANALYIITVLPVNDPPIALDDFTTLPNDTTSVTVTVQANDTDVEPSPVFSVTLLCLPTHGSALVIAGEIVYFPDSTYLGTDSLCYLLCDNGTIQMCDTAYVYFNIFNGNEAPIALPDGDSTSYLDAVSFPILTNDSDPNGHQIDITVIGCGPLNGTVTLDTLLGIITYTPDSLFLGTDSFCYVICDNPPAGPAFCDTAYVSIVVESDNRAPIAIRDTMTVLFNTPGTRNILANDSDPDSVDALTALLISQPANGSMLLSGGLATYTPNPTFTGADSARYQLCDNGYTSLCDSAYIVFFVLAPNDLIVPNGFSPNGDGANDVLEIEAISLFPNNFLQIFNRWGSMVFEAQGYNNEWDGTFNGNPVPDGTYFYTLDPGDGTAVVTGFILVYR